METRFLPLIRLRLPKRIPHLQLRPFHHNPPDQNPKDPQEQKQVHPLGGYYTSILESSSSPSPPTTNPPISPPSSSSTPPESDPSDPPILFTSRLSSPLQRRSELKKASTLIAGILVPPKPTEPDNCCMSGCVNCVWDRYGEEMVEWAGARRDADEALKNEREKEGVKVEVEGRRNGEGGGEGLESVKGDWENMRGKGRRMGGEKGEDGEKVGLDLDSDDLFKGVPVGIREFMKQEKRLKDKRAREEAVGAG